MSQTSTQRASARPRTAPSKANGVASHPSGAHEPAGAASPAATPATLVHALVAESFGTFALTLVAAGGLVINAVSRGQVDAVARTVAPGLMVMAMIYTLGDVSGAHINPSVTVAFALRGDFPWRRVPLYWLAQLAGALVAPALLLLLFGNVAHLGTTVPHAGAGTALAMEVVLTTLLASVILGTATRGKILGANAALAVGATVALDGLFAAPISGASMNPALSLGPALVSGTLATVWIYLLGPFTGAAIAVLLTWAHHGRRRWGEREMAEGDQQAANDDQRAR